MPRWLRVIRGMIGTGLTFAAGVGVVGSLIGGAVWLFGGSSLSVLDLVALVGKSSVIAFPVGVLFSGVLALTARGRLFDRLSIPRFAALGAGAGLLVFTMLGVNGAFWRWSMSDAIANVVILTLLGGGSAAGTLMLARRGRPALDAGDEPHRLTDG